MLLIIILVVVAILLFNTFSKFNTLIRNNESIVLQAEKDLKVNPEDIEARYAKASGLMRLQKYPDAIREYRIVASAPYVAHDNLALVESAKHNIDFCSSPLPWSGKMPEDQSGSYVHNLMLKYFGNSRNVLTRK